MAQSTKLETEARHCCSRYHISLTDQVFNFYDHSSACVRIAGNQSNSFVAKIELRNGCGIFSWLVVNLMDKVVKRGQR